MRTLWSRLQTTSTTILIEAPPEVALNATKGMVAGFSFKEDEVVLSEISDRSAARFLRENPGTMVIRKSFMEVRG